MIDDLVTRLRAMHANGMLNSVDEQYLQACRDAAYQIEWLQTRLIRALERALELMARDPPHCPNCHCKQTPSKTIAELAAKANFDLDSV